ncbi:hypothetical protein [Amycolatopsis sp. H20-H5]|uniref:hypothetical protein n=1 Tax=Amycolatopsis sp. H20-H5 TaxID=3046309 RepID=UPI002DB9531A|nr:hypothetical protein [Amycolatopsis sp. H20-H5]MEC3974356.1 hypothetical protein [Amycolatopsis sp. H20-H5]
MSAPATPMLTGRWSGNRSGGWNEPAAYLAPSVPGFALVICARQDRLLFDPFVASARERVAEQYGVPRMYAIEPWCQTPEMLAAARVGVAFIRHRSIASNFAIGRAV